VKGRRKIQWKKGENSDCMCAVNNKFV